MCFLRTFRLQEVPARVSMSPLAPIPSSDSVCIWKQASVRNDMVGQKHDQFRDPSEVPLFGTKLILDLIIPHRFYLSTYASEDEAQYEIIKPLTCSIHAPILMLFFMIFEDMNI
jgi:hypothetical protein